MGLRFAHAFVVAAAILTLTAPDAAGQLQPVSDPDAYAIYTVLLTAAWGNRFTSDVLRDGFLLQQETEPTVRCRERPASDPAWLEVQESFRRTNTQRQVLLRDMLMLPTKYRYRLIPVADIEADDARLALKYPGLWQRRPESIEYTALSAVGFNGAKTKAIAYIRSRGGGRVQAMERRDDQWVLGPGIGCGWAA